MAQSPLLQKIALRAVQRGIPLTVQMDLTYRCNERCIHCYLDHEDHGELTLDEICNILSQLARAGTLFLTFSGGEIFVRRDIFEIISHARKLQFDINLKSNGILIDLEKARRIRALGVRKVQLSVYSQRAEVHDGITKVRGSFERTLAAIRFLKSAGLNVQIACPLMKQNFSDYTGVKELAESLGVTWTFDATITPKMDGNTSVTALRIGRQQLFKVFQDRALNPETAACPTMPDTGAEPNELDSAPCSAGHNSCYISPYADVFPCVQFPLPTGNLRREAFEDIWYRSPAMKKVRNIKVSDLPVCSKCPVSGSCSRCPGLAYMEGDMVGPSSADCEKAIIRRAAEGSDHSRWFENLQAARRSSDSPLFQILPAAPANHFISIHATQGEQV